MTVCITNDLPDIRSCTIKGEHAEICDGWGYRQGEDGSWVATGRECTGCAPREAEHGLLCWACWTDVNDAENAYGPLVTLLENHDRLVAAAGDGVRTAPGATIPLPPTTVALDEINSYRRFHPGRVDIWVASIDGAAEAVHFARVVKGALRSFPYQEEEHKIQRTRCARCDQLTLMWKPPRFAGDDVTVKCANPLCAFELDQSAFEIVADARARKPQAAA